MIKLIERVEIDNEDEKEVQFLTLGKIKNHINYGHDYEDYFISFNGKIYQILGEIDSKNEIIVSKSDVFENPDISTYDSSHWDLKCCFCGTELGLENPYDGDEEECSVCSGKQIINIEHKFESEPLEYPKIKYVK